MAEYANPDVLVSTEWVAEHQNDPAVRIVESNEDRALYTQGHIPGAVEIDWLIDLQNQDIRDYVDRAGFEKICRANGISNDTTVVFYGDQNNWWPATPFGSSNSTVTSGARSWTGAAKSGNSMAAVGHPNEFPIRRPVTPPLSKTSRYGPCGMMS